MQGPKPFPHSLHFVYPNEQESRLHPVTLPGMQIFFGRLHSVRMPFSHKRMPAQPLISHGIFSPSLQEAGETSNESEPMHSPEDAESSCSPAARFERGNVARAPICSPTLFPSRCSAIGIPSPQEEVAKTDIEPPSIARPDVSSKIVCDGGVCTGGVVSTIFSCQGASPTKRTAITRSRRKRNTKPVFTFPTP